MRQTIRFSWQALYRADLPLFKYLSASPMLKFEEPRAYFNRISVKDATLYHPIDLRPINLFHIQLRRGLRNRFDIQVRGWNFPYEFPIRQFGRQCRISVAMQLFLPDLLSVRTVCHEQFALNEGFAFRARHLNSSPELLFISDEAAKIVNHAICRDGQFKRIQVKPLIRIHYDTNDDAFLSENEALPVALLINDELYRDSNRQIFDRVLADNRDHNLKAQKSKLILINKQAYLAVTNNRAQHSEPVVQEIKKRERMFELGCALQRFYETYPTNRQGHMSEMDYLFFATQPYIKQPKITFALSYGNTLAWSVILDALKLREAFDQATRFEVGSVSKLANLFDRIPTPHYAEPAFWAEVRRTLGEDYMAKEKSGPHIKIGTMHGSIATGNHSTASTVNINAEDKSELLRVIEQLAQLRDGVPEGSKREDFDEHVVALRAEVKAKKPDKGRLSGLIGAIKSILMGAASEAAATGLVAIIGKLAGVAG